MVAMPNLEHILRHGLYCKNECPNKKGFVTIGSKEIISQRDRVKVKCYPLTAVNDYVPFYFSVRTPMLYNIHTGHNVPAYPQRNIVYLCFKLTELATNEFQWCYTDGNAAKSITKYYTNLDNIETNIDWHSITTTDFRDANADGDNDRVRKKHSEFLVKAHVPTNRIKAIVVLNEEKKMEVESILENLDLDIKVKINPSSKFYF